MASCASMSLTVSPSALLNRQLTVVKAGTAAPKLVVSNKSRVVMSSRKEQSLAGPTAAALVAAAILPEIAEAAQPGVSSSLKNLLLSVLAGGAVLGLIGVAVAGVSLFDPVSRK